jgi:ribosomal subunit interface protein
MQLQISFHGVEQCDTLQKAIQQRATKLARFHDHIISCRVVVELAARHQRHGNEYNVRLDIKVPGAEIVANQEGDKDLQVALRDAFDAARRKLEDHARRQRGDVKQHSTPGT